MANIDRFRIDELDERLKAITVSYEAIQHPILTKNHKGCNRAQSAARCDEAAVQSATYAVKRLIHSLDGVTFSQWAADVIDAFGFEQFPSYCKEPHSANYEGVVPLPRLLTGTDDTNQAGLRMILWVASCVTPSLLLADDGWSNSYGLRESVLEWAGQLIVRDGQGYRTDPEPIKWIRQAFDGLVARFYSEDEEPPGPKSAITLVDSKKFKVNVNGKAKTLSMKRFNVINALVEAYPGKLTKDQLIVKSGASDAVNVLSRLRKADADFALATKMGESTGGGYGVLPAK